LSAILLLTVHLKGAQRSLRLAGMAAAGVLVSVTAQPLFDQTYERLLFKRTFTPQTRFAAVVETKSGVVTVTDDGIVFGGGTYDGKINTNIVNDSNGIVRAYFASALHAAPKTVLMIGLSSGSWAQVIANNPAVAEMTIVEINPGYRKVLATHPDVASLPMNAKVKLVIDDGRRWLARNPQARFDMVIMNTTFPWRAQATNLFSIEFLELVRAHLNPGGIVFYNSLNTPEVQKTATIAFPYVMRIRNCIAASESPIHIDKARWVALLSNQKIDGVPVCRRQPTNRRSRKSERYWLVRRRDLNPLLIWHSGNGISKRRRASLLERLTEAMSPMTTWSPSGPPGNPFWRG